MIVNSRPWSPSVLWLGPLNALLGWPTRLVVNLTAAQMPGCPYAKRSTPEAKR